MSRSPRLSLACLLAVLLLAVAGCGDTTDVEQAGTSGPTASPSQTAAPGDEEWDALVQEWDGLVLEGQALVEKNNALEARGKKLMAKVDKFEIGTPSSADAVPLLAEMAVLIGKQKKNSQALAALWDEAAELDVSDVNTTYAGQQKEIAEVLSQFQAVERQMILKLKRFYEPEWLSARSQAELDQLAEVLDDLEAKADELASRAAEMEQASEQYYNDNWE